MDMKAFVALPYLLRWTWRHSSVMRWTWRHSFNIHILWDEQQASASLPQLWDEHEGIRFTSVSIDMNLNASVSFPHLLRWAWRHSFHFHIIWHIFWDEHEDILRWTWRHPCISRYLLKWTWRHSFHFHICWDEQEGICFTSIPIDMNVKSFVSLPYLLRCTRRHSFHSHIVCREHIFTILLNTCAFICDWVIRIYFLPFP